MGKPLSRARSPAPPTARPGWTKPWVHARQEDRHETDGITLLLLVSGAASAGLAPLWKAGAYFFTVPLNSVSISRSAAGGASI
jgi:hypothetical protein